MKDRPATMPNLSNLCRYTPDGTVDQL